MKQLKIILLLLSCTLLSCTQWEVEHVVDKFGDETDVTYFTNSVSGVFSNSVAADKKLTANVSIRDISNTPHVIFHFIEYRYSVATFYYSTDYMINIKDEDGDIHQFNATVFTSHHLISGDKKLINLMVDNKRLRFIVEETNSPFESYTPTKYEFTLNTRGLSKILE